MKPSFNDDYYAKSVETWETDTMPNLLSSKRIGWFLRLFPALLVSGFCLAGYSWRVWLALAAAMYLCVTILTFLEEINENLRYVRHQLRSFRYAVRAVNEQVSKYRDPEKNFTLYDALDSTDRAWEDPD